MIDFGVEPELNDTERDVLIEWANQPDVPDDFADRVMGAWQAWNDVPESWDSTPNPSTEAPPWPRSENEAPSRGWRSFGVALMSVAAAGLIAWWIAPLAEVGFQPSIAHATELERARHQASMDLERYCSPCHTSSSPSSESAAIAAFDLNDSAWWNRLSTTQLYGLQDRFESIDTPTLDERRGVRSFVALEIATR